MGEHRAARFDIEKLKALIKSPRYDVEGERANLSKTQVKMINSAVGALKNMTVVAEDIVQPFKNDDGSINIKMIGWD